MQYFTFLGTGLKKIKGNSQMIGYEEAYYYFQEQPEKAYISYFVQIPIIDKFVNEITDIYVFCTEESKLMHGARLEEVIRSDFEKEIKFIKIPYDIKVEELLKIMDKILCDDFIIDVTHCFRNIPIELTFITKYLEKSKQKNLLHLYYGNFNQNTGEGIIYDLIKDYNDSKIISALESFDKFLRVSDEFLNQKNDVKIQKLIQAFSKFNHMLEYCEFDESILAINHIYEFSQSVLKDMDNYILLIPYLKSIQNKLENIYREKNDAIKKIKLIKLLLKHNLSQIAITFTDQLIREELIHYCYFPNEERVKEYEMKKLGDIYKLSQDLLYELDIRQKPRNYKEDFTITMLRKEKMNIKKNINIIDKESIDKFYKEIRNVVNHGGKIKDKIDINLIIEKCILSLERFIREG